MKRALSELTTPRKKHRRISIPRTPSTQPDMSSSSMDISTNSANAPTGTRRTAMRSGIRKPKGRKLTARQKADVKRLIHINQELKYFPFLFASTGISSTMTIDGTMFDVPQATTTSPDTRRIGDSLMWCGTMEVNLLVVNGLGATGDTYNNVRVVIFQWHDVSQATPVPLASSILLNGPINTTTPDVLSVYNHDNRHQYTILYDNTFSTVGSGQSASQPLTAATSAGVHRIRINLNKLARKNVQYVGGGGQGSNRFFMLYGSDSVLATHPFLVFSSKVFFRDS